MIQKPHGLYKILVCIGITIGLSSAKQQVNAQTTTPEYANGDSTVKVATLENLIQYALKNQPIIKQALNTEKLADAQIRSQLAAILPQINFNYIYQHNIQVPTNIINGNVVPLGVGNTSNLQLQLAQNLFNRNLFVASRAQGDVRLQARQLTNSERIDVVTNVTKAFYDVVSTAQRIRVTAEDTVRLARSLLDAYNRYVAGIVDKIDYKRATIDLNNARADLRSSEQQVRAKIENLKFLIGYPISDSLKLVYDSNQLEKDAFIDTTQRADYTRRIEYDLLQTERRLLEFNLKLAKLAYLPQVSINAGYNFNYYNSTVTKLYGNNFPSSFAQVVLTVPIYQGGKRKADVRYAELELQNNQWDIYILRNSVNSEYAQAKATYNANLINYTTLRENLALAQEVYDVVQLQYRNGIKAYIEVVTAETALRSARLNYYDALYQLLSSKVDVQKALGEIRF